MELTMNDPDASLLDRDRRDLHRRVTLNGDRVVCRFSYYDEGQGPQLRAFYPINGDGVIVNEKNRRSHVQFDPNELNGA